MGYDKIIDMKLSSNPQWKGNKAKYQAFHNFVRRNFGKPSICELCKVTDKRMYHWAAKDKIKGGRRRTDWLRLCVPCHAKYDGRTGRKMSEETKRKIGKKNSINSLGNKSALGHRLSLKKRKEISIKTKLGMKRKKLLG